MQEWWVMPVIVPPNYDVMGAIWPFRLMTCVQTAREEMPMVRDDALVYIRRQWNGKKMGAVPSDQFHNPYWDDISGEMMQRAPRPFIHGYVWCTDVQDQIAHLRAHEIGPRWIKVCVVRKDNHREVFKRLLEIVGPKPKWKMGEYWPERQYDRFH